MYIYMNFIKSLFTIILICSFLSVFSQNPSVAFKGEVTENDDVPISNILIKGKVTENDGVPISNVTIGVTEGNDKAIIAVALTSEEGMFTVSNLKSGTYNFTFSHLSYVDLTKTVQVDTEGKTIDIILEDNTFTFDGLTVTSTLGQNDLGRLPGVRGTAIFVSKKNEVVLMDKINANVAVNNPRQIFAKVVGTNIWENDGSGIQLNVSNRGLSPNRSWEYNTRQNGYDIAADILGYPDNYYTPTMEAVEKIEVVRGAASLQYGTQLGGMMNFKLREAPRNKPFEFVTKQTRGSYNLFNSYQSIGGRKGKTKYFAYYHHRSADAWRENGDYNINSAYASIKHKVNKKLTIGAEMTKMSYILHLSAGVTDEQFELDPRISNRERNWFQVNWNLPAVTLDYDIGKETKFSMKTFAILSSRNSIENTDPVNIPDHNSFRDLRRDKYRNFGAEVKLLTKYKLFSDTKSTLLVGTRMYKGETTRGQGLGTDGIDPNFNFINPDAVEYNNYTFDTKNIAFFAENIFQLTTNLSVTPGIRYENINLDFDGYFNNEGILINESDNHTRKFPLLGVGIQYQIAEDVNFYSNISEGFRGVNFNDVRVENPNIDVDSDIKDSKGYNADMGFRGEIKEMINFDVNVFYLAYNDKIGTTTRTVDNQTRLYRTNIADSRNMGIESFVELNILKAINSTSPYYLGLFSSYAYVNSEYLNGEFKGNKVEFAPEHIFKTGFSFRSNHFSSTLNFSHISSQYADANNTEYSETGNLGYIPAYSVLDLSAKYMMNKYTVSVGVNNVLNSKYFSRRASSYPGPGIIPGEPINYFVSLGFKI